jgi:ribosomal protein S18 acetylase RimI-like enzyme
MVQIRRMLEDDVVKTVPVHMQSFPGFFLSFLGEHFLREFYTGVVRNPSSIAYVCVEAGRIQGFIVGTCEPAGFYRRLLRGRWCQFGIAAAKPFLRNPRILPRLLRALGKSKELEYGPGVGTLISLAVLPNAQSEGLGRSLVQAFLEDARSRKLLEVNLTTDALANEIVNRFYLHLGFRLHKTFTTPEGRKMNEYRMLLSQEQTQ